MRIVLDLERPVRSTLRGGVHGEESVLVVRPVETGLVIERRVGEEGPWFRKVGKLTPHLRGEPPGARERRVERGAPGNVHVPARREPDERLQGPRPGRPTVRRHGPEVRAVRGNRRALKVFHHPAATLVEVEVERRRRDARRARRVAVLRDERATHVRARERGVRPRREEVHLPGETRGARLLNRVGANRRRRARRRVQPMHVRSRQGRGQRRGARVEVRVREADAVVRRRRGGVRDEPGLVRLHARAAPKARLRARVANVGRGVAVKSRAASPRGGGRGGLHRRRHAEALNRKRPGSPYTEQVVDLLLGIQPVQRGHGVTIEGPRDVLNGEIRGLAGRDFPVYAISPRTCLGASVEPGRLLEQFVERK